MDFISLPLIRTPSILGGSKTSYDTTVTKVGKLYGSSNKSDEIINYEDRSKDNKLISSTKVNYYYPNKSFKSYKQHKSFKDLCEYIARKRNPNLSKNSSLEISNTSFSALNRADLQTDVTLSRALKKHLGLEGKSNDEIRNLLQIESFYEHNSEFNGHSYIDKEGKLVKINTGISSSADRKALNTQNLSVVKAAGKNLLYTGRPDTLEKAEEQARFILSSKAEIPMLQKASNSTMISSEKPKWIQGKEGIRWNPHTKCIELPYVIYSIMSDSNLLASWYKLIKSPENNEKLFIENELETLKKLKKEPILVKDADGNVFKVVCQPILLSQSFNSFSTTKGFMLEGTLSPVILLKGWVALRSLLKNQPNTIKKVVHHIHTLDNYFKGKTHLSSLHLFLHMNIVLSELNGKHENLPLVLHCKSSTDRTGIGAAILSTLAQFKKLNISIPSDMSLLTKDSKFKELFALNWIPLWYQRSKYSRDVEGISFGSSIGQNPIVVECLPERYLKKSRSKRRFVFSAALATGNFIGSAFMALHRTNLFILNLLAYKFSLTSEEKLLDSFIVANNAILESSKLSFYPNTRVNEKGLKFKSQKGTPRSPLDKSKAL